MLHQLITYIHALNGLTRINTRWFLCISGGIIGKYFTCYC